MDKNDLQVISDLFDKKLGPIQTQLSEVKQDITGLKSQVDENTQILISIEEAGRAHKADIDNLTYKAASMEGQIKTINEKFDDLKDVKQVTKENCFEIAKLKAVK